MDQGMRRTRQRLLLGLFAASLPMLGCVSQEKYDRLMWENRNAAAHNTALQSELDDARTLNESLRSRLASYEMSASDKDRLIANLQAENDKIDAESARIKALLEAMAGNTVSPVVVMERRLPPELDSAIKKFAAQHPDAVVYDEERGIIKWGSDVLFVSGSDVVRESAFQALRDFAAILKSDAAAGFEVGIVGHTDNVPVRREETRRLHPTNWHLSAHRAISVGNILIDSGYDPGRVSVTGRGEFNPMVANDSEANRAQNRRVEIYIVPIGTKVASGMATMGVDRDTK